MAKYDDIGRLLCQIISPNTKDEKLIHLTKDLYLEIWQELIKTAQPHGVAPLLYLQLIKDNRILSRIPDDIFKALRQSYLTNATRNMFFLHHAGMLFEALNKSGIPAIGLKGIYLVENIYDNIALRPMSDLDILVKRGDIPRTLAILHTLDYRETSYFNPGDENLDIKHVPPFKKPDGPFVEVHWSLLDEARPLSIHTEGLWARAKNARIANMEALTLSVEDLLLHLCIHCAYQHRLRAGLSSLYDLLIIVERHYDQIDWQALAERARAWGAARVVSLTFHLLTDLFGFNIPGEFFGLLQQEPIDPLILAGAKDHILQGPLEGPVNMSPDLARFSSTPDLKGKIHLVLQRIFIPKRVMARLYGVPTNSLKLYFYYPLRFWKLFSDYYRTVLQLSQGNVNVRASIDREDSGQNLLCWMEGQPNSKCRHYES